MRAKDLEAGVEYLWSNSHQWASGGYANTARVRVEDTQTVYAVFNGRETTDKPVNPGSPMYSKATVKTVMLNAVTGEVLRDGKPFYARPVDLRAPWAEGDAKRKAAREAAKAAMYADDQRRQEAEDRAHGRRLLAAALGVTVQPRRKQGTTHDYMYELTDADLTMLLARLAATAAGRAVPPGSRTNPNA